MTKIAELCGFWGYLGARMSVISGCFETSETGLGYLSATRRIEIGMHEELPTVTLEII